MGNQYDGKLTHQQQSELLKTLAGLLERNEGTPAGECIADMMLEVNEARSVEDVAEGVPPLAYVGRHRPEDRRG